MPESPEGFRDHKSWTNTHLLLPLEAPESSSEGIDFGSGIVANALAVDILDKIKDVSSLSPLDPDLMSEANIESSLNFAAWRGPEEMSDWSFDVSEPAGMEAPSATPPTQRTSPITVYVIAAATHQDQAEAAITKWANGSSSELFGEPNVQASIFWEMDEIGWFDMNNSMMFTVNQEMHDNWCHILGLRKSSVLQGLFDALGGLL